MNRDAAVNAVREIMMGPRAHEAERLDRIHCALKPWTETDAAIALGRARHSNEPSSGMKWRSQTNYLPLVCDVYAQSMKVDNYLSSDTRETAGPWEWWLRNKMGARQTGLIRSTIEYGVAYTSALPSLNPMGGPLGAYVRCISPRQMTCLYGEPMEWVPGETPVDDDWPIMALEIKGPSIRLYDEEFVHFLGAQRVPESALGWTDPMYSSADNFHYIEKRSHDVGVCPIVRYRDRWLLNGEEQYGIIEPLINIQARIDETTYEMSVAQYFTAFVQRWVAGWRPQDEAEALAMIAGDVWYFSKSDIKVGQFDAGDVKGYLESRQAAKMDLASIGQVPALEIKGLDALVNISEATLAGFEAGKDHKAAEIQTALGESFEQLLRTCAYITDDKDAAADFGAQVSWQDTTARSFAQTIDGLVKLLTVGVPEELLLEMVPGATKTWVDRAIALRKEAQAELEAAPPQLVLPGACSRDRGQRVNALQYRRLQDKAAAPLFRRILAWFRLLGVPITDPHTQTMAEHLWRPVLNARDRNYAAAVKYLRSQVPPTQLLIPAQPGYPLEALTTAIKPIVHDLRINGDPITERNRHDHNVVEIARKAVEGRITTHVQEPARQVIQQVADNTDAWGWARMLTGPTSCSFCAMQASRGPVYTSREAAVGRGGSPLTAYHAPYVNKNGKTVGGTCDCVAVLVTNYQTWEGRQSFEMLEDLWQNTAKGSGKDARNSFRRSWDAKVRSGESARYMPESI